MRYRPAQKNEQAEAAERKAEQENGRLREEIAVWRTRAEWTRGQNAALRKENERLRDDNVRLSQSIVDIALKPPDIPDIAAILDQFRRTVTPDIRIDNRPDGSDEQRRGINWADQGLDNTGGTSDTTRGPFDDEPISIPDYVLDVESLDPQTVKGTRGGWYNPPKSA